MIFKRKEASVSNSSQCVEDNSHILNYKKAVNIVNRGTITSLITRKRDLWFYILFLIWPITQFAVMYIGVNFNSILLAFQKIDITSNTITWTFDNITNAYNNLIHNAEWNKPLVNALKSFLLIQGIGIPMALIFSYYIAKNKKGSNLFRVLLFLPSIIPAIVMSTIYRIFVERAIPEYGKLITGTLPQGLLENPATLYGTIIFFNLWIGFGTSILLYSNAMSGVDKEITEAARIDGATGFTEFWKVTLPSIFPTLKTFIITSIAGIFANQIGLYSLFGKAASPDVQTLGYLLYVRTQEATSTAEYPFLCAIGILITIVVIPTTLIVNKLLDTYGPRTN